MQATVWETNDPYARYEVAHEHEWGEEGKPFHAGQVEQSKWKTATAAGAGGNVPSGRFCAKCGAWSGAYGQESSVSLYVWHTVLICREIRRVMRDDAVLFWNLGDSYSGNGGSSPAQGQNGIFGSRDGASDKLNDQKYRAADPTIPAKNLLLVPFRVALALQEDGWIIRQDIIWSKSSPMPESVADRPTTSHEHILMLAKKPYYFYDNFAVRVPGTPEQTEHNRRYAREYYRSLEALDGGVPAAQNNQGMHARPGVGGHNLTSVWVLHQPMARLRSDLTPEQRAYVLERLVAQERRGFTKTI